MTECGAAILDEPLFFRLVGERQAEVQVIDLGGAELVPVRGGAIQARVWRIHARGASGQRQYQGAKGQHVWSSHGVRIMASFGVTALYTLDIFPRSAMRFVGLRQPAGRQGKVTGNRRLSAKTNAAGSVRPGGTGRRTA